MKSKQIPVPCSAFLSTDLTSFLTDLTSFLAASCAAARSFLAASWASALALAATVQRQRDEVRISNCRTTLLFRERLVPKQLTLCLRLLSCFCGSSPLLLCCFLGSSLALSGYKGQPNEVRSNFSMSSTHFGKNRSKHQLTLCLCLLSCFCGGSTFLLCCFLGSSLDLGGYDKGRETRLVPIFQ